MNIRQRRTVLARDDRDLLLTAATAAPSLHNSQPWSFAVDGRTIALYADRSRHLMRTDPSGRSLFISCGAALFNLRVAAEHLGFHPRVRLFPNPGDLTMVAGVNLDHHHRYVGGLAGYYSAVATRRTNRLPFQDRTIPHLALAALADSASAEGAMLRSYDDATEVSRIVDLLHAADFATADDRAVRVERQAWIGGPHRTDGIPVRSLGPRPEGLGTPYRDLGQYVAGAREYARFELAPTIAVISTLHDHRADWVRAGQALERVLLEATRVGLAASFMNQPLENDALRGLVRSPETGVGHSHMIMRIGYGDPVPPTPRRPIAETLRDRDT